MAVELRFIPPANRYRDCTPRRSPGRGVANDQEGHVDQADR